MEFSNLNWDTIREGFILLWVVGINYLLVFFISLKILLENRNPQKTYAFVILLIVVPFVGILFYFSFGQNYRRNKIFNRKRIFDDKSFQEIATRLTKKSSEYRYDKDHPLRKISELLLTGSHSLLTGGNSLELLINGENCFPKMLEAIAQAKNHIHMEYYIFTDDELGIQFIKALANKSEEGVEVRLIYDAAGSLKLSNKGISILERAGVQLLPFLPIRFPRLANSLNYRNHRKILVVDGVIGFVGGINIDQRYDNRFNNKVYWRDTHLKISGNGVWNLQFTFLFDWYFCVKDPINFSDDFFPISESSPSIAPLQVVSSGPDSDWSNIMYAYLTSINLAQSNIRLTTPYFIPNDSILMSLKTAALGGVNVELLIPEESDSTIVKYAMRSYFKQLLEAGVKIFLYRKGFVHAKTMTVDDSFCTIGTANMDFRSFELNFEVNAFIYDQNLTQMLVSQFEEDKKESVQLMLSDVGRWKLPVRLGHSFARLFAPLL